MPVPPEEHLHTVADRARFVAPPCPRCGAGRVPTWIESGSSGPGQDRLFRLTHLHCPSGC